MKNLPNFQTYHGHVMLLFCLLFNILQCFFICSIEFEINIEIKESRQKMILFLSHLYTVFVIVKKKMKEKWKDMLKKFKEWHGMVRAG